MASWRLLEAQRRPGRSTEHAKLSNSKNKNMLFNHIQQGFVQGKQNKQNSDFKKFINNLFGKFWQIEKVMTVLAYSKKST